MIKTLQRLLDIGQAFYHDLQTCLLTCSLFLINKLFILPCLLTPTPPTHGLSFTVAQDIPCPNITPGSLCLVEVQNSFKTQLTSSCESFGSLKLVDVGMAEKS